MKILFLGTGAADYSYETDGNTEGYRRNSSALIDDKILIDPGPCVCEAIKTFNVDVSKIKYVLNTHSHSDHFDAQTLEYLQKNGVKHVDFGNNEVKKLDEYEVTALVGNHSIPVQHFIIEKEGRKLFYGLDSAWLMYEEIQAIIEKKIDFAVFDATIGFIDGDYRIFEHCSTNMVIEMKKSLSEHISRFCISHMAKTLHTDHKTLSDEMKKYNIETAFDGFCTEI